MKESSRNLVVFDIETSGLDKSKDHIIQFAALKVDQTTNEIIDTYNTYIQPCGAYTMSMGAYIKHKISPEFLKDKPFFVDVAGDIYDFIKDCDILTFNGIAFDIPFLQESFHEVGIEWSALNVNCYDACIEERRRVSNKQEAVFERYKGCTMEEYGLTAHDAFSDIKATFEIFLEQQKVKEYDPEPLICDDNFISMQEFDGKQYPSFTFGKYQGIPIQLVKKSDPGYLTWCVSERASFAKSTKDYISKFI